MSKGTHRHFQNFLLAALEFRFCDKRATITKEYIEIVIISTGGGGVALCPHPNSTMHWFISLIYSLLPSTLVGNLSLLLFYSYYRQILADVLLRDRLDLDSTGKQMKFSFR